MNEAIKEKYKEFNGRFEKNANNLVYDMLQEGYTPLSIADIMINRVLEGKIYPIIMNGTDTIDAIAYNKEGNAKIILDSQHILTMNYQTKYSQRYCCLPLKDEEFEELTGDKVLFVPKERLEEIGDKRHKSLDSVKDSKEWNFLARSPKNLSDYLEFFLPLIKEAQPSFTPDMGAFSFDSLNRGSNLPLNMLLGVQIGEEFTRSSLSVHDLFNGTNSYIAKKRYTP